MVVRISIFKGYGDGTGTIMVIRYWMMVFMLLVPWSVFGAEEWFPPLVKDAKGRVPLVREALHFRACGDKAFVALVEGGWYWRHLETGKVVPLPQLDASLTRMDTDYFIGCSRDGMDLYHSNLEKKKDAHGRDPGTTLFQIKNRRSTIISNVRLYLDWAPSGKLVAVIWSGMKPNPNDQGIQVRFPKGLGYVPVMMNLGDLSKGEWIGEFFVRRWQEDLMEEPEVLLVGSMIIRNHDENEKKAEVLPKRIHGDWIVDKNSGSFKLFAEGGPDDVPENCQNLHCYDAIQLGEMPGADKYFFWGIFRQHNWEGPMQFRERMMFLDVDQPGDELVEGAFLHTQIESQIFSFEVDTKGNNISIYIDGIDWTDGIEMNDIGLTKKFDSLPVPVNIPDERGGLAETGHVDAEFFPHFIMEHHERTLLARQVSGWETCGDHALVLNVKGSWYWRDIQTGRVVRLPQEINEMTPVHCSPDGQDVYLKKTEAGGMFLYRLQEGRMMQISQKGLNFTWTPDGKKLAMVWTGVSFSVDGRPWFEQPWIRFPGKIGYRPILLWPSRLPNINRINELDRNHFQWVPGERYLLGHNCFSQGNQKPTQENHESFVSPMSLWDAGDKRDGLNMCKDWPVFDLVDWENTLFYFDEIYTLQDGIVISGSDLEVRSKHYYCQEWRSCAVLWNGTYYRELIQNGMELWSRTDNQIGKVDWETGKIVCRVDADSKARFLDGRLIRTENGKVWLEKVGCP